MGKNKSRSILGDYSGTVGTVVLAIYRGIPTMRSKPKPSSKPASPKQLDQRRIFRIITKLLSPLTEVFKLGYQMPRKSRWSPENAAVSYHILNAIGGERGNPHFDLTKLKLTQPVRNTQSAWNAQVHVEDGNIVTLSWELNPYPDKRAQLDDKVCFVMYNKTEDRFKSCIRICNREDLSYSVTLQQRYKGTELYFYMFLISEDGKLISETEYLGMSHLPG